MAADEAITLNETEFYRRGMLMARFTKDTMVWGLFMGIQEPRQ